MRVLVVEDNPALRQCVVEGLEACGMLTTVMDNGLHANQDLQDATKEGRQYDAIVLDLTLPGMDGLDVLKRMRSRKDMTPVVILTARSSVIERVNGLELGADDYLAKPFDIAELVARLRVVGRRHLQWESMTPAVGNLTLNVSTNGFMVDGKALPLPPKARAILEALFRRRGSVVNNDFLTSMDSDGSSIASIHQQIFKLRRRLEMAGARVSLKSSKGTGYILDAEEAEIAQT